MSKGYWIAHVSVRDADRYPEYIAAAAPVFEEYGANFVVRGGRFDGVEGTARSRHVVIEFPGYDAALACYNSPEYAKARTIRQSVADADILIIEGV